MTILDEQNMQQGNVRCDSVTPYIHEHVLKLDCVYVPLLAFSA